MRCTSGASIRRLVVPPCLPTRGRRIGASEHAQLLAAFNGGFKMGAGCIPCGVGGMEVAGRLFP